jgi:hypothetical protein
MSVNRIVPHMIDKLRRSVQAPSGGILRMSGNIRLLIGLDLVDGGATALTTVVI